MESTPVNPVKLHEQVSMDLNKSASQPHVFFKNASSFLIPDSWKPTSSRVVRWVENLPGAVKRDEVLDPAHFHGHALNNKGLNGNELPNNDDQPKKYTIVRHRGWVPSRRLRLKRATRRIARRVSRVCRRVVTLGKQPLESDSDSIPDMIASGSGDSEEDDGLYHHSMRFIFLGDAGCGKSSLLLRYYQNFFTLGYVPTQYESFTKDVTIGEDHVTLRVQNNSIISTH
ncbi:hypothetical protein F4804DRAFT_339548 [Jackrogersella minutella]|nr:hypothetical protein F4804DRAFT_339548 [Jackrogersella minutella]